MIYTNSKRNIWTFYLSCLLRHILWNECFYTIKSGFSPSISPVSMAGCGNVAKVFVSYARRVQVTTEPQMGLTILPQVFRQKYQAAAGSCPLGSRYSKHQPYPGPSWKCRTSGLTNMRIISWHHPGLWLRGTLRSDEPGVTLLRDWCWS